MSHLLEQDTATESSENEDEDLDNCFESNDTDSIHFDDDEEEERSVLSLSYNPSERLIGGSIIFHIDQANALQQARARRNTFSVPIPPYESRAQSTNGIGAATTTMSLPLPHADQSTSTTTTLSESDNLSTQAVLGDTPSTTALNPVLGEDDLDNSSHASMADPDAERVRRIHNSIFSSLEHDLAELVRIREETIQFLETGTRGNEGSGSGFNSENEHISTRDLNNNGESDDVAQQSTPADEQADPFFLRERLTFPTRPFRRVNYSTSQGVTDDVEDSNPNTITMNGRSYTPAANFDDAEPGKPGKPYLETGLASCDEKANAARKVVEKLQYGDPEDESACFIRRFWRETSTVVDHSPSQTESMSSTMDASTLIQRTESLQASLEEAFGGLRLRLQQVQAQAAEHARLELEREGTTPGESSRQEGPNRETVGESGHGVSSNNGNSIVGGEAPSYFNAWDEETSIMNNPLNYDIWDELVDGNDAGPSITARINLSEPRPTSNGRMFNPFVPRQRFNNNNNATATVSVGTDSGNMDDDGGELDDEDEDVLNFLRFRNRNNDDREDSRDILRNFRSETRDFFRGIGISEEAGRDIFNMFTLAEDSVPSARSGGDDVTLSTSEMPEPFLLPNSNGGVNSCERPGRGAESDEDIDYLEGVLPCTCSEGDEDDDEVDVMQNVVEQVPLVDTTECSLFVPNREDDCSTRVYLDENDLTFAHSSSNPENQEAQQ